MIAKEVRTMKRALLALGLVVALTSMVSLALPSGARADQIGLGGANGTITFTSNGDGTLSFSTGGFTVSFPLATFQSPNGTVQDAGSAILGPMNGGTGLESNGDFSITSGGTENFNFSSTTDADALSGTITWAGIKDDTTTPMFDISSFLNIASSSGDPQFTTDFPVGRLAEIDMTISGPTTLTALADGSAGTKGTYNFSSGELHAVPEPATFILLGAGLLALGLIGFRKKMFNS